MISFRCHSCGKAYKVRPEHGGKTIKCPGCEVLIVLPFAMAPATAPMPPTPVQKPASPKPPIQTRSQITENHAVQNVFPQKLRPIDPCQLPDEIRSKLQSGEIIYHFGYIGSKGGCSNPSSSFVQWLLVTERRILFEASVKQGTDDVGQFVHQSGSVPMAKVSYVGSATSQKQEGCASVPTIHLIINSSGGGIVLAIPTKAEADRVQAVIDGIISAKA